MKKYFLLIFVFISMADYAKEYSLFNPFLEILERNKENEYLAGDYKLYIDGKTYDMKISVRCNKPKAIIKFNNEKISSKFSLKKNIISIKLNEENIYIKLIGKVLNATGAMGGVAYNSNGKRSEWSAAKIIKEVRSKTKGVKKKN